MKEEIILGAHDAFTYGKPVRVIDYLFRPFGRCQERTPLSLLLAGVRCFDIRVRFDETGKPYACHGLYRNDVNVEEEIENLYQVNTHITESDPNNSPLYFRLILEISKPDNKQELLFQHWCEKLMNNYKEAKFIELRRKGDWKRLVMPNCTEPTIIQSVGSMAKDARWYEKILPITYARRTNKCRLRYNETPTNQSIEPTVSLTGQTYILLFDFL